MKILFLCRANIGRSQMAEALFNKLCNGTSQSSGAKVKEGRGGRKLWGIKGAENVLLCMKKVGLDVSQNKVKQVTSEMVETADSIIVMTSKENLPDFVLKSDKLEFWDVKDPKGTDLENHCRTRDEIKNLIKMKL